MRRTCIKILRNEKATKKELTETSPCPSHSKECHALLLVSPQPLYNLKQQNQNQILLTINSNKINLHYLIIMQSIIDNELPGTTGTP